MNINLIYEGKNYNFDIPNNVTIDYLKELSSKIFNSEKELLDLFYNNKKVNGNGENTLIRDLIPEGESNAILTVQINKNLRINNQKIKKERKKFNENLKPNKETNEINKDDNKYEIVKERKKNQIKQNIEENFNNNNENIILENIYNNNIQSKIKMMLSSDNKLNIKGMNKKEKFNNIYIQKNGELLSLIRQFSDKIKKIYLILYNKYKISNKNISSNTSTISNVKITRNDILNINLKDNSFYELALYEKKIMNYLEIQIQYYKSLLETIQNYDNNINFTKLTDFYHKLFMFIPEENYNNKIKKVNMIKGPNKKNKNLTNSNSSINLTSLNSNKNKLPKIKLKNYKSPIIKEIKKETFLNDNKWNINSNINETSDTQKENKENKKNNTNKKSNIEDDNISSNNNTNKNNILDNITEKNSIESNTEINENINDLNNISPIRLKKNASSKIFMEKNEIDNDITPIKEIKLYQRKDSDLNNINKFRNNLDKKVSLDLDINQNKKEKKIKEINISSMTVKDSNFTLEKKNYAQKEKKNSINKYDYVM